MFVNSYLEMCTYYVIMMFYQSFLLNKSSTISQFIISKSRDPQKLIRYLSGIVTSALKNGTGGYAGRSTSSRFPGCVSLSSVSVTIFVLYSNDLPSEALLLTSTSLILSL